MKILDDQFPVEGIDDPTQHLRGAVRINGGDLRAELERLPADLAHYGFEFAKSHRRMMLAKVALDELKSAVYLEVRETLNDLGKSRTTESEVDAHVSQDTRVREARSAHVEAEYERESLRAVVDALRAKRESLTSLALLARAELAGQHGFRDPQVSDQDGKIW